MTRLLITGSRTWQSRWVVEQAIQHVIFERGTPLTVVHGDAIGADRMADDFARKLFANGVKVEVHRPDWDRIGKRAGIARNQLMVDLGADICLAFIRDESNGATHCAEAAQHAGIPVRLFIETSY